MLYSKLMEKEAFISKNNTLQILLITQLNEGLRIFEKLIFT